MHKIKSIESNIIFQFVEDVTSTRFKNSSASGFIITSDDGNQTSQPRWAKTIDVGPNVTEIKPGDFILIEAGKWTPGFELNGERFWKTDDQRVIATSDQPGHTY